MPERDLNLDPIPEKQSFTDYLRKASETKFYKKALVYRKAYLRGGLGIAIAMLTADIAHPEHWKETTLAGLIAWRLFIDSSVADAKEEVKKL